MVCISLSAIPSVLFQAKPPHQDPGAGAISWWVRARIPSSVLVLLELNQPRSLSRAREGSKRQGSPRSRACAAELTFGQKPSRPCLLLSAPLLAKGGRAPASPRALCGVCSSPADGSVAPSPAELVSQPVRDLLSAPGASPGCTVSTEQHVSVLELPARTWVPVCALSLPRWCQTLCLSPFQPQKLHFN